VWHPDAVPLTLGAYVLTGDPTWLRSSLERYYPLLADLVVLVPADRLGWTGRPIPVDECLAIVRAVDHRGIHRVVEGTWRDEQAPLRAETAQRQAGVDALQDVDWVLQIDNDEVLPTPASLVRMIEAAEDSGARAVEWPMRVLFRRIGPQRFLQVCAPNGEPHHEYPGPVAVRSDVTLVQARRTDEPYLRAAVTGDTWSLQLTRPAEARESRVATLEGSEAIVHNSWGRSSRSIWRKIRTWGHARDTRALPYYFLVWLPAPLTWRWLRDLHPMERIVWPRVRPTRLAEALLQESDR
jgi:hypothetical protein